MSSSIICQKGFIEQYTLREPGHWWAIIVLSPGGLLSIVSDYGNYGYIWNSFGTDFKKFLMDCDKFYLYGKLGAGLPKEFNVGETVKRIRQDIIKARRDQTLNQGQARDIWDSVRDILGFSGEYEMQDFVHHGVFSDELMLVYDGDYSAIPVVMDNNSQLMAFLERVWPEFMTCLKQEILTPNINAI